MFTKVTQLITFITNNNRGVVVTLILVTLSGIMLPIVVSETTNSISHEVVFGGTPVVDTIFSDITSETPDQVMLPGGVVNRTQDTIIMRADYNSLVTVNLSDAISIALDFISGVSYLSNRTLDLDLVDSEYNQATWFLRFKDNQLKIKVSVNAISGKIAGFSSMWIDSSPNPYLKDVNTVNILDVSTIEESALQFLSVMNYTLSPHTMVHPPDLETGTHYFSGSRFTIRFYGTMNRTHIEGNQIFLHLDIETGEVLAFGYYWTYFRQIPVEHMISASHAEIAAFAYINEQRSYSEVQVTSSILTFENWGRLLANVSDYRLEWVVHGTFSQDAVPFVVWVHPLSGVAWLLSDVQLYNIPIVSPTGVSRIQVIWALSLSLAVAAISYVLVKRYIPMIDRTPEQATDGAVLSVQC